MIHYAAIMAVLIVILHSLPGITRSLDADFTRLDPVAVLKQLGAGCAVQTFWLCTNIQKVIIVMNQYCHCHLVQITHERSVRIILIAKITVN